ncbi:MAG: hypothetical protein D6769_02770 [Methanobacteriota archaeon]|nr:MAG: hypothetical protein D6769_02770 [Euryarchaeota archaeon]
MEKAFLCDSSSIITLVDSCFGGLFAFLSKKYGVDFYITPDVKKEIVDRPLSMEMKAYRMSALRIKRMLDNEVLKEIDADTEDMTEELMDLANNIFSIKGRKIHLIDPGETDLISVANTLRIDRLLIDERTTRLLIEAPFTIQKHFEEELGVDVDFDKKVYRTFEQHVRGLSVFRSTELLAVAYKAGYFEKFGDASHDAFVAALYKAKYSGCAVRFDEIEEMARFL